MPVSIQIRRWPIQPEVWRFVGFVSTVVGLLCYALSSSFNYLFGEWNFMKIFLYVIFSSIIFFMPLVAKVWQISVSNLFKTHMGILLLLATSVYSVFFDKAVNQKPDAYILISCAAFAVMSLCLSKQTHYGCEVDLLNFFLGFLVVLLMKKNMWLFFVGAGFSYSLTIIRSWSDIRFTPQSEDFEPQDHFAIEVDSLLQQISDITHSINSTRHQIPDKMHRNILNTHCENIKSMLRMESKEVQTVGIWGMGGIGKTTIARALFDQLPVQFDCTCFLENIREDLDRHGLNYVFSRLFSQLLRRDVDIDIDAPEVIPSTVRSILRHKKALIVLDDVTSLEFVETLNGLSHHWMGAGSIIILTSRDRHVLMSGGVDIIYEVNKMNIQDSLQLFSLYAFNQIYPETEYQELSKSIVVCSQGIPVALEVLGSFLRSKTKSEWELALRRLENPNQNIQDILKVSFDTLEDAEREIFLDIACFFEGHDRDHVSRVLDACGFHADIGIRILLDKGLINIDSHNCIKLHDLVLEMGRKIICDESIDDPGRRSRLWKSREVMDVLIHYSGTAAVESVFLDMTKIRNLHLSSYAFKKMPNLRLLAFDGGDSLMINNPVSIPEDLELPRKLRYLHWDGYPLNSLPSIRCKQLVDLSMPQSNLQKLWDGAQDLPMLKNINLAFSKHLIECPDLSGSPKLESVSFLGCENLVNLHPSIFTLQNLEELDVIGCTSLTSFCSKTFPPSLQRLYAVGCTNPRVLNHNAGNSDVEVESNESDEELSE